MVPKQRHKQPTHPQPPERLFLSLFILTDAREQDLPAFALRRDLSRLDAPKRREKMSSLAISDSRSFSKEQNENRTPCARVCICMSVCVCARARCVAFLARATGVKIGRVKCSGLSTWLDPLPTRNPSLSSQKSQILFLAVEARACSSCQTSAEVGTKGPIPEPRGHQGENKKKNNK